MAKKDDKILRGKRGKTTDKPNDVEAIESDPERAWRETGSRLVERRQNFNVPPCDECGQPWPEGGVGFNVTGGSLERCQTCLQPISPTEPTTAGHEVEKADELSLTPAEHFAYTQDGGLTRDDNGRLTLVGLSVAEAIWLVNYQRTRAPRQRPSDDDRARELLLLDRYHKERFRTLNAAPKMPKPPRH